jgi:predicted SAM-dependent methyltransferase
MRIKLIKKIFQRANISSKIVGLRTVLWFLKDWEVYQSMPNAELLEYDDAYPCVYDRTSLTPFDVHYFYQDIWAFKHIKELSPAFHLDIGSLVSYVVFITAVTKVVFVDIRPLHVNNLDKFDSISGNILDLPFEDNSIPSLSCLHVAEHIGLGRYGDPLDPLGTKKAAKELVRILTPAGNLYFSVPVGKPRVCFNAHRIHSPQQILNYFSDLHLVEFSGIDDKGIFKQGIKPDELAESDYACGLFHFTKKP